MPQTRHIWGQIRCRGSPAQVRHGTSLFFKAGPLLWSPAWVPRSMDHAWGGTGCPEGQALKPCSSELDPWRVGSCCNFCPSSIAQLPRPALLKWVSLCFRPLIWQNLPCTWLTWIQVPPQPKKIQTVTPRGQPNPRSTQTTASLSAKLLFIFKSNLPLKRTVF